MKPTFRAVPLYKTRIINTPSIPISITVKPKAAVQIPTIHTKSVAVFRQPSRKMAKIGRPGKPAGVVAELLPTITKPVVRERTLTTVRPSQLRKAHDVLLSKHTDKIRSFRGIGQGRILIILACGPSVNDAKIQELIGHPKIDILCINKPEPRAWPSKYWMLCDQSQYMRNQDAWASYHGIIICASSVRATHPDQVMVRTISGKGFSRDMTKGLHVGRSTTYASMQMGLYMGYSKIYIFGCDMSSVNGQMHRYGQNPDVTNDNRAKRFAKEAENFEFGTSSLNSGEKNKFTFCSRHNPFSFTKQYENLDERDAHETILVKANELMTKKELELANI
jgi:hypothetical protein